MNRLIRLQKKEDLEIRMRLEKAALVDLKMKSTIKHHLNKLKLINEKNHWFLKHFASKK